MCDMTHSLVWHDALLCFTWLIHACDVTHLCVWHDPFMCVTWLIRIHDMPHSYAWHASFMCVTRLIHMCDVNNSHVWHDSTTRTDLSLSTACVWHDSFRWGTHSYEFHDSFLCVTWPIHMCDMIYLNVGHDSFICVTWFIHMSSMTHVYRQQDCCHKIPKIREHISTLDRVRDVTRYTHTHT